MSQQIRPLPRTHTLDNLRTFLTILVIFHHAALAYGGLGAFSYRSPHRSVGSSFILVAFNGVNQTFFMALFFLLSGYFSAIAAKKRSRLKFLKEKGKRLGVPTVVYSLLGEGIIRAIVAWRGEGATWIAVKSEFMNGMRGVRGVRGPVWYTALLLVFDAIYTLIRPRHFAQPIPLSPSPASQSVSNSSTAKPNDVANTPDANPRTPNHLCTSHIFLALTLSAICSFLIRTRFPFCHIFVPLNLNLGYAPQYVLYYCTGIFLQRAKIRLEETVHVHTIYQVGAFAAGLAILGVLKTRQTICQGGSLAKILEDAGGGVNTFAVLYALLNELIGFIIIALLLRAFYNPRLPFLSSHWTFFGIDVARYSYAAFLVHIPVLVDCICRLDEEVWASSVAKTLYVGVVGTVESWVLGWVVKEGVDRFTGRGYI